jgi:metal-responsive CopG/Arc/MetJ family transcriptional regulator
MTIKTAISLDQALFEEAETLATALRVSRSRLYGLALRDYLRRQANRARFEQLNRVYGETAAAVADPSLVHVHTRSHRKLVEGTW